MPRTVIKVLIIFYLCSALSVAVVTARAFQSRAEYEQFREKIEAQQAIEQEKQAIEQEKQAVNGQRLTDIERRIDKVESEKIVERLTTLEAKSETTLELLIGIAISIFGLLVETTWRLISNLKLSKRMEERGQ